MPTFPTGFDAMPTSHVTEEVISATEANKANAALNAMQTKIGKGASTPAAGKVYMGDNATDTSWHDPTHAALADVTTDTAPTDIHHTIGTTANQAAAGNHTHAGGGTSPVNVVTGDNTGATDVSATVAAILAAGQTPYFPAGTWLVSGLTLSSGQTVLGAGMGKTILKQKAASASVFALAANASDVRIVDLAIDATLGGTQHVALDFRGGPTRCGIERVKITGAPDYIAALVNNSGGTSATAWFSATAYSVGNVVSYGRRYYRCTATRSATATPPDWDTTHWAQVRYGNYLKDCLFQDNFVHIYVGNVVGTLIENVTCERATQTDNADAAVTISDAHWTMIRGLRSLHGRTQGLTISASHNCHLEQVESAYNNSQTRWDTRGLTIIGPSIDGYVVNSTFRHNGENGCLINNDASTGWTFIGCHFDDNGQDNPTTDPGGSHAATQFGRHGCEVLSERAAFVDCTFNRNSRSGLWNGGHYTTVHGGSADGNGERGYADSGSNGTRIYGMRAFDNGTSDPTGNSYAGFELYTPGFTPATNFEGRGLVAGNSSGTTPQMCGVNVPAGCTNARIIGGTFTNNHGAGGAEQIFCAEPTAVFQDTVGFPVLGSGTSAIPSGSTSVAVTHGLIDTPRITDVTITPTNSLGSATKLWVSAVGATTFTVSCDVNPGATTAAFAWKAIWRR